MRPGRAGLPEPTPVSDSVVVPSTLVKLTTPARGEVSQAAPSAQVAVVIPLLRETVSGAAATGGASHAPRSKSRSKTAVATDRWFMRGLLRSRLLWRDAEIDQRSGAGRRRQQEEQDPLEPSSNCSVRVQGCPRDWAFVGPCREKLRNCKLEHRRCQVRNG